jgi:hypothetical protein
MAVLGRLAREDAKDQAAALGAKAALMFLNGRPVEEIAQLATDRDFAASALTGPIARGFGGLPKTGPAVRNIEALRKLLRKAAGLPPAPPPSRR